MEVLNVQYRMAPAIRHFPSAHFYNGRLMDGPQITQRPKEPWQLDSSLGSYAFYNVTSGREHRAQGQKSLENRKEAELAVALYTILESLATVPGPGVLELYRRCCVITPYKAQVQCIQNEFRKAGYVRKGPSYPS